MPEHLTLGMESLSIGDSQLTASSQQDDQYGPECARLNHHIDGGAWIPETSNVSQFLQIDTGWIVILTGIAIQGHPTESYRITAFQMKHATNLNQQFEPYSKGNIPKVFQILLSKRCQRAESMNNLYLPFFLQLFFFKC